MWVLHILGVRGNAIWRAAGLTFFTRYFEIIEVLLHQSVDSRLGTSDMVYLYSNVIMQVSHCADDLPG